MYQDNANDDQDYGDESRNDGAFAELFPAEFWPNERQNNAKREGYDELARVGDRGCEGAVCEAERVAEDEIANGINQAVAIDDGDSFEFVFLEDVFDVASPAWHNRGRYEVERETPQNIPEKHRPGVVSVVANMRKDDRADARDNDVNEQPNVALEFVFVDFFIAVSLCE